MTLLSWPSIKTNATRFATQYADARNERSEAQTFWNDFFQIFGIERRRVAIYEKTVKKLNKQPGFMDLFWPGVLLVEHKSAGQKLELAHSQAEDYFVGLKDGEHPRYMVVCDFQNFWIRDLDEGTEARFKLAELPANISLFGFLGGRQSASIRADDPINDKAVRKLSRLHAALQGDGFKGHPLQLLLVRLLFCLFADKTGLFEPAGKFTDLIENGTREDGGDLGPVLNQLFDELDTRMEERQKAVPGWFHDYPYVNGRLFAEKVRTPSFNAAMRALLLDCCHTDWSRISPAIFGSMFQHIIDARATAAHDIRRELGAHYTSEENILKLIGPLFLDELKAELLAAKSSQKKLFEFQKKLRGLRFLDPACGCGNFLVITYRELRLLELDVLRAVQGFGTHIADPFKAVTVDVDQFNGIEVEEFPALVAQVAMWLVDHQMNVQAGDLLQQWLPRLPLNRSANIRIGNALALDWAEFCPPERLNYILGNPPFIGKQNQTAAQKEDMARVLAGTDIRSGGVLDYVAAWYIKATQYLAGDRAAQADERRRAFADAAFAGARQADLLGASEHAGEQVARSSINDIFQMAEQQDEAARQKIGVAFVSTNSICQGEQVGVLWSWMLKEGMRVEFAHRTFSWSNDAAGEAAVHCVIVGFGLAGRVDKRATRRLFDYSDVNAKPVESTVARLNPYLIDAPDVVLPNRRTALCAVPPIVFGSMPNDGGHLLLNDADKLALLAVEPDAGAWIKPFLGAEEFINRTTRWCLWLKGCPPDALARLPQVRGRVAKVKAHRLASSRETTRRLAATPQLFGEIRQAASRYILVPAHSSERRSFVPIGFIGSDSIAGNANLVIPDATLYHFGILSSTMHNAWMRYTCGRLKSDYRYSAGIVYNNFPWPDLEQNVLPAPASPAQEAIEKGAQSVLDARAAHPDASLAVLYDAATMPPALVKAHQLLDRAVDAAYGAKKMKSDAERVAFLFERYQALVERIGTAGVSVEAPEIEETD